ncbi:hypothetical protein GFS60_07200 (plasmid) [Rhodococcus sp. WAY2]|nr:hypothetical protein GFS60_07200 [Rhodococcus sp. WAY2]
MCTYLDIDARALPSLLELADAKLAAALRTTGTEPEEQP